MINEFDKIEKELAYHIFLAVYSKNINKIEGIEKEFTSNHDLTIITAHKFKINYIDRPSKTNLFKSQMIHLFKSQN